jgi:hypothetical protein
MCLVSWPKAKSGKTCQAREGGWRAQESRLSRNKCRLSFP